MSVTMNDYASNNSINENKYNSAKLRGASRIHKLKQLLKPVLAVLLRKSAARKNTYRRTVQPEYCGEDSAYESDQNDANERLEGDIVAEIDRCADGAAVPVYRDGEDHVDVVAVHRGHHYIPVHFAKTAAGTFFWTTMASADSDICCHGDKLASSQGQFPEEQVPCDRWAQA